MKWEKIPTIEDYIEINEMSEEKLPRVEIPLSYLTKEELIKILLELKEQSEAMNKRLNNQCELLEKQHKELEKFIHDKHITHKK